MGKRLAEHNRRRREEKKREQAKLEKSGVNQYYRMGSLCDPGPTGAIGAVIALGVIGGHIYQSKKGEQPWGHTATLGPQGPSSNPQQNNPKPHPQVQLETNKFEMD